MEQSRKNLKIASIVVLIYNLSTMLGLVSEILFGELNNATIPEDAPDNILMITKVFLLVLSAILLLPQIYISLKGLKVAKNPDSSRIHIILAIIILAFTAFDLVSPVTSLIQQGMNFETILEITSVAVEVCIYYEYIKFAREVRV